MGAAFRDIDRPGRGHGVRHTLTLRCWYVLTSCLLCLPITSCNSSNDSISTYDTPDLITRSAGDGPVKLNVTLASAEVQINQPLRLSIEVITEPGVTLIKSDYAHVLAQSDQRFEFQVLPVDSPQEKRKEDGTQITRYDYDLLFFLPGEFTLPPVEISYLSSGLPSEGSTDSVYPSAETSPNASDLQSVQTDAIVLTAIEPAAEALSEADLRTITRLDPVDLPAPWEKWWWLIALGTLAIVILAIVMLRRRKQETPSVVIEIPAHVWAKQRLAELVAENLITRGLVQPYYYRISGIVRGYIERRFHVSAPEMTTEEFLISASSDPRFIGEIATELAQFMNACDLVKYARHQPGLEESETVLHAAEGFVDHTRKRSVSDQPANTQTPSHQERVA